MTEKKEETKEKNSFEFIQAQEEAHSVDMNWDKFSHLYRAPDCCWK